MSAHFNTKMVETAGVPALTRKPQGNRRIVRAQGFHRAWLMQIISDASKTARASF